MVIHIQGNPTQSFDIWYSGHNALYMADGNWHKIEVYVKYNTGGANWKADGIHRVWFDGVIIKDKTDAVFRDDTWPNAIFTMVYIPSNAGDGTHYAQSGGCPSPMPQGMVICSDIEESDNVPGTVWGHYSEHFDLGPADRWLVSGNCYEGNYCIESMSPNENGEASDSIIRFNYALSWNQELFIRYAAKFPVDWESEATDYNYNGSGPDGGANHFRLDGGNNRDIEATFADGWLHGGTWFHWYDSYVEWGPSLFLKDNQWHEYTIYVKMPSSSTASDGMFRAWRDGYGHYNQQNAFLNYTGASQSTEFFAVPVGSPCYYKGPVQPISVDGLTSSGNWQFWLDRYEIWDRIPAEKQFHEADTNQNGCIEIPELNAFIDRWKVNSQDVTVREIMEAIGLWTKGC